MKDLKPSTPASAIAFSTAGCPELLLVNPPQKPESTQSFPWQNPQFLLSLFI